MKEKKSVRRVILSVIAIAVIVAMVLILILSAVRAEEAAEDTHPAQSSETIGEDTPSETEQDGSAPAEQTGEEHKVTENNDAEQTSESQKTQNANDQEPEGKKPDPQGDDNKENSKDSNSSDNKTEPDSCLKIDKVNGSSGLLNIRPRPVMSNEYKNLNEIKSKYAVVMDADTDTIIAGKQPGQRMFPASLTKVMTLVTAVDFLPDMDSTFSITLEESDDFYRQNASVAGYMPGEPAKASDMLYGLILPSGADCALGLARLTAGDMQTFTEMMNLEGFKMGLRDSHFSNTSGLHDENNYSTVLDLAVIFRYALDNELCRKVLGTPSYKTEKTEIHPEGIELWSHTFSYMTGVEMGGFEVIAGKTGYTEEAGACMVTAAKKDEKTYIVVTGFALNSRDMCADHIDIYKMIAEGKI